MLRVLNEVMDLAPQARALFEERVEVGSAFANTDIAVRVSKDKTYLSIIGIINTVLARLDAPAIYKTYFKNTQDQDTFDPNNIDAYSKYKLGFTPALRSIEALSKPMIVAVFPGLVTKEDLEKLGVRHVFLSMSKEACHVESDIWLSDEKQLIVVECGPERLHQLHELGLPFNAIYPNTVFKTNVLESLMSRNAPLLLQYVESVFDDLIHAFGTAKAMRIELVKNLDVHQALITTINNKRYSHE